MAHVYDAATGTQLAEVALPAQPQGESMTYLDCATLLVGSEGDSQVWTVPLPDAAIPADGCDGGPGPTTTSTTSSTSTSSTTSSTSTSSTSTSSTSTTSTSTTTTTVPGSLRVANPGDQTSRIFAEVELPIEVDGGQGSVRCSASGLPRGLWMNGSACEIVGWPFALGESTVTVTARDGQGQTASVTFGWTVAWG